MQPGGGGGASLTWGPPAAGGPGRPGGRRGGSRHSRGAPRRPGTPHTRPRSSAAGRGPSRGGGDGTPHPEPPDGSATGDPGPPGPLACPPAGRCLRPGPPRPTRPAGPPGAPAGPEPARPPPRCPFPAGNRGQARRPGHTPSPPPKATILLAPSPVWRPPCPPGPHRLREPPDCQAGHPAQHKHPPPDGRPGPSSRRRQARSVSGSVTSSASLRNRPGRPSMSLTLWVQARSRGHHPTHGQRRDEGQLAPGPTPRFKTPRTAHFL